MPALRVQIPQVVRFTNGKEQEMRRADDVQVLTPIDRLLVREILTDRLDGDRVGRLHEKELDYVFSNSELERIFSNF